MSNANKFQYLMNTVQTKGTKAHFAWALCEHLFSLVPLERTLFVQMRALPLIFSWRRTAIGKRKV